jgi:hypothetical protein
MERHRNADDRIKQGRFPPRPSTEQAKEQADDGGDADPQS